MQGEFEKLKRLLGVKGLNQKQAKNFLQICYKKPLTPKEISKLCKFKDDSIGHKFAKTLVDANLARRISISPKKYEIYHPQKIISGLTEDLQDLGSEMYLLEEQYESQPCIDEMELSSTLENISCVESVCENLLFDKSELKLIYKKNGLLKKHLKRFDKFNDKIEKAEGEFDVILYKNETYSGVIFFLKNIYNTIQGVQINSISLFEDFKLKIKNAK